MALLDIKGLTVKYNTKTVLKNITAEIYKNKITAVIGPSGCGKTTLLHCINGMIQEEKIAKVEGSVLLNDQDIERIPCDELRRRIGLVFQTPAPFPFSIYKNMTYAPKYYGIKDKARLKEIVVEKLTMAGLYDEVKDELNKNARQLSGGQQQRLCIARALTVEPEILLLDEPCSALDVQSTDIIEKMLVKLKEKYTVVMVTHNIQQAQRISDRVMFLYNGELIEYDAAEQFFLKPQRKETKDFLEGTFG